MSKVNTLEKEVLELIFNNTGIAELGDATGVLPSATTGNLYVALYTVMPTDSTAGTEATYTGYARVAVPRTTAGWTVTGTDPTYVYNTANITFPSSTSSETIVGCGICFTSTSNPKYYLTFVNSLSVISGSIPRIQAGQLKINED